MYVYTCQLFFNQPTEGSIVIAAEKMGLTPSVKRFERVEEIPFSSARKWMAVRSTDTSGKSSSASKWYVKGSLEAILKRSTFRKNNATDSVSNCIFVNQITIFASFVIFL